MGKISQYNRQKLPSAAAGVPRASTAGATIAKGATELGNALMKRQAALDNVTLTKKEYQLKRAYNLERTELQASMRENPEEFREADNQLYDKVLGEVQGSLSSRLQNSFSSKMLGYREKEEIKNDGWIFNQQNQNALIEYQEISDEFIYQSGVVRTPQEFIDEYNAYEDAYKVDVRPTVNAKAGDLVFDRTRKQATLSFINGLSDAATGDPLSLMGYLEDPEFKKIAVKELGTKAYNTAKTNTLKQISKANGIKRFDLFSTALQETPEQLDLILSGDRTLADASNAVDALKNTLLLKTDTNAQLPDGTGVNDGEIEFLTQQVKQAEILRRLARDRNDYVVGESDAAVKGEFVGRIADIAQRLSKSESAKDVRRQSQGVELSFGDALIAMVSPATALRAQEGELPAQVKANKSRSKLVEELHSLQADILEARDRGSLLDADVQNLFTGLSKPIGRELINSYDSVKAGLAGGFSKAYNAFEKYVSEQEILASLGEDRKDFFRTQMALEYAQRVNGLDDVGALTVQVMNAEIASVKQMFAAQIYPDFAGYSNGDVVTLPSGASGVFRGFNALTGKPMVESKKVVQDLENS